MYSVYFYRSGALRQEKLELSAQVKKLQATVDHLQGSLNQAYEEVILYINCRQLFVSLCHGKTRAEELIYSVYM